MSCRKLVRALSTVPLPAGRPVQPRDAKLSGLRRSLLECSAKSKVVLALAESRRTLAAASATLRRHPPSRISCEQAGNHTFPRRAGEYRLPPGGRLENERRNESGAKEEESDIEEQNSRIAPW